MADGLSSVIYGPRATASDGRSGPVGIRAQITSRPVWLSQPTLVDRRNDANRTRRVLVVDDDENLIRLLRIILRTAGLEVVTATDGAEALRIAAEEVVHLIVLDLRMPGLDGREVFRELRARHIDTPVLIASAYGARSAQVELGAQGAIEKPFDPEDLIEAVTGLLPPGELE